MAHVVPRTQSGIRAEVVHVAFRRMAAHRHGHPPDVGPPGAQEAVPEPHVAGQFRVVPGIPAHVVPPRVPHGIVRVHEVAVVPEPVPPVLVHSLDVIVQVILQAVFHPRPLRVRPVGQAPHAERLLGMEIFRRAQQGRVLGQQRGHLRHPCLSAISPGRHEGQRMGPRHPVGRAHAFLHILITGFQPVCHAVIVSKVHRPTVGTPQPHRQFRTVPCRPVHLQARRVRLPEVLQGHAQAAAHVPGEDIARGAGAEERPDPRAVRMGAFADGEGIRHRLAQPETVPRGPMVHQAPVLGIEPFIRGDTLTAHLPCLPVRLPVQRQHPPPDQRLHGFGPHAAFRRGEGHMAVVRRLPHGYLEPYAQAPDKITVHIAVEHESMHHLDLLAARIEIETHRKGQP